MIIKTFNVRMARVLQYLLLVFALAIPSWVHAGQPPVVNAADNYTQEDVPVNGNLNDFAYDPEGGPLTFSVISNSDEGFLNLNANGSYTYTPFLNQYGVEYMTFQACDNEGFCVTGELEMAVFFVNDPPICVDDSYFVESGSTFSGNVFTNDIEYDNEPITFSVLIGAQHGVFTLGINGAFTYTPNVGYLGSDNLTLMGCDPCNTCDVSLLNLITTPPTNPPVAGDDNASGDEDTAISGSVATNDSDPDGDPLTYAVLLPPAHGTFSLSPSGTYTYTPALNFWGSDVVWYQVCDPTGHCDQAQLFLEVNFVNDPPIAVDESYSTNEDVPVSGNVATNDIEYDVEALIYDVITGPPSGTWNLSSSGTFTYNPALNFNGMVQMVYAAIDPCGSMDFGVLTITVVAVNDPPVCVNDAATLNEDNIGSGNVALNDSDVENQPLFFTVVTGSTHGSFNMDLGGIWSYTPVLNYYGTDQVTYQAQDIQGATAQGILTITVNSVNDVPYCGADFSDVTEDTEQTGNVALNDSDADNEILVYSIQNNAQHGLFLLSSNGSWTYTPQQNYIGTDLVMYRATDPSGAFGIGVLSLDVGGVNDPPSLQTAAYSGNEDVAINGNLSGLASDPDGDALIFAMAVQAAHGIVVLNSNGSFTYQPQQDYNGVDQFTASVSDPDGASDQKVFQIILAPVNDAPVASDDMENGSEDSVLIGSAATNDSDVDGDVLTYVLNSGTEHGDLSWFSDGSYSYLPDPNYFGTDSWTYEVSDGSGLTAEALVSVNISPVNDAPQAGDDVFTTVMNTSVVGSVAGNDFDVDGDALLYSVGVPALHGTVFISADGMISYQPVADYSGTDVFTYSVCDNQGGCTTAQVEVTVAFTNALPIAGDDLIEQNEDEISSFDLSLNDSDEEDGTLTYSLITDSQYGLLVLGGDGSGTFQPDQDYSGTEMLTYEVCDSWGGCSQAIMTIQVDPVNDAPVAVGESASGTEDVVIVGTLSGNDSDVDSNVLIYSLLINGLHGDIVISADGSFVYTPDLNYHGTDVLTYSVCDDLGACETAELVIALASVNDAPVANNDSKSGSEDNTLFGTVASNDSDPDGGSLNYSIVNAPVHGTLNLNANGTYNFVPQANFHGLDYATYQVCDGGGLCDQGILTITILSINDIPVAVDDSFTGPENALISGELYTNDADVDIEPLFYSVLSGTSHGTLVVDENGIFEYQPDPDYVGTDEALYMACDSCNACSVAHIYFDVYLVNLPPVAEDDALVTDMDTNVSGNLGVDVTDPEGQELIYGVITPTSHGLFQLSFNGAFIYMPYDGYYGSDEVICQACDPYGACVEFYISIEVVYVVQNTPPVASAWSSTGCTNSTIVIDFNDLISDGEDSNDQLTISILSLSSGDLVDEGSQVYSFLPATDFSGLVDMTYQVCDTHGACVESTISIEITPTILAEPVEALVQDVSCYGSNDGTIDLTLPAGNWNLLWNTGLQAEDLVDLSPGEYSVTIGSEAECSVPVYHSYVIAEPEELVISGLIGDMIDEDPGGSGTYTVDGGTPPYSYLWLNGIGETISEDMEFSNLLLADQAGDYTVEVTDAHGCSVQSMISITGIDEWIQGTEMHAWYDPAARIITCSTGLSSSSAELFLTDEQGRVIYKGHLESSIVRLAAGDLASGIYFIQVVSSDSASIARIVVR